MSMLLATIAFMLSLGALWFTSEFAKRTETRNKLIVKPHLAPLQQSLHRAEEQIRDLHRELEAAHRAIDLLRTGARYEAIDPSLMPPPSADLPSADHRFHPSAAHHA